MVSATLMVQVLLDVNMATSKNKVHLKGALVVTRKLKQTVM